MPCGSHLMPPWWSLSLHDVVVGEGYFGLSSEQEFLTILMRANTVSQFDRCGRSVLLL